MKEIPVYRYEEIIYAPIDVVFDYVNDDDKIKEWNTMFVENIYESEDDNQALKRGTTFQTVQKIEKKTFTVDSEVIEYDPPYKIVMHATSKEGISVSSYILLREYDGTRLVVEASMIPANLYYKVMTKLFGWSTKYVFDDHYKKLKPYIEDEVKDW